ncbi:HTH-type transcriptional regulator CynR [Ascidiaceihabitans donghaensis]|uniref:HTH-type transcriptional regulator CynR n=1 Tax=Ascidiaceihabitans donghaensis TaxID=1510460 RepID=A0A2R8BIH7_9RHOB|nr:LysR family transcriptional regulator [Ascidiaceihabitans donghaensis]SPH22925.1 HTH-type transcriptional regulator CynR [Ascidiaceihabitans donghaensis]
MAIKLEMLKCFTMVAQHGSLSDAAQALGRTPSAVSMMLKQFEDHIGSPLFETARKSRLTALGALIYEEARREVGHFENTVTVIEGISRSKLGYLRLAVTPSVATTLLPPVIRAFTADHPQVQVEIRDMDSAAIAEELFHERADIGIGSLPDTEGMTRRALFSDSFGVVCRKDNPLVQDWDRLTWRNMGDHALIANGLCDLITDPDFAPFLAKSRLRVPNSTSLLSLVREGVGITILPRMAAPGLQDDLAFLPLVDIATRRTVSVMSSRSHMLMPAARAFLDALEITVATDSFSTVPEIQKF